jgi:hypothetical protein
MRVFWQIMPFLDGFCILKTLDTGVSKILKTVTLSGIILLSLCSTAMAEVVPRCRCSGEAQSGKLFQIKVPNRLLAATV